ncbi:hypothetical protein ACFYRZ_37550, partial [Streptomyces avermitilis]
HDRHRTGAVISGASRLQTEDRIPARPEGRDSPRRTRDGAFEDKHALFLRALDSYNSDALRAWRTALGGPGPALPTLARHVRNVADGIIGDAERRGCMMAKIAAELSAVDVSRLPGRPRSEVTSQRRSEAGPQ